jgi:porphobilinogen synthase
VAAGGRPGRRADSVRDPQAKDATGSAGLDPDGIAQRALRAVVGEVGDATVVMSDLCLDDYTDHGHCGVLAPDGSVDNDATLALYAEMAVVQARAGAQVVAPSGMMDGQVGAVRTALDGAGFADVSVLAYSAKYASSLYGPFREAVQSSLVGDRRAYQQDPANTDEALREVALDIAEGADMVMVKPAAAYLDIVRRVADAVTVPVAAYQVSGEYAMVEAAAANGWIDRERMIVETLTSIRRGGRAGRADVLGGRGRRAPDLAERPHALSPIMQDVTGSPRPLRWKDPTMAKAPKSDKKPKGAEKKAAKAEAEKIAKAAAKQEKRAEQAAKASKLEAKSAKAGRSAKAAKGGKGEKGAKGGKGGKDTRKAGRSTGDAGSAGGVAVGEVRVPRQAGPKDVTDVTDVTPRARPARAFPLDGYDSLTVAQVRAQLPGLDRPALQQIHDYEAGAKGRVTLLSVLRTALSD